MYQFIDNIKKQDFYKEQIKNVKLIPLNKPIYGKLDKPLPTKIQKYLKKKKIKLYIHQTEAINSLRKNENVVIATPTASGKTLAFNIPVFEALINDKEATALYIYPAKALANDQHQVLLEMEKDMSLSINPNIYDGDTPTNKRPNIRKKSRIILSNPYGIHQYLSYHHKWKNFFQKLHFIIIDETHMYRGVFGSNIAFLIKRLRRICEYYGSKPNIILSSATIANPKEHSKKLVGIDFKVITKDGSERGNKFFIFWNPPFIDKGITRRSPHQETKDLFVFNISSKFQTLCFTISRKMAELIIRWSRDEFKKKRLNMTNLITSYRAGYLPEERRSIEEKLRNKELLGVISTNALELGIDIGSLDSVIISGYPGTIISTWQQAGRAGRTIKDSIVTLVAFQNPLDQYFMKHPQEFFGKPHEYAIIDLKNPYILMGQLMCASAELPITKSDKKYFPILLDKSLKELEGQSLICKTVKGWVYSGITRPVEIVNLENISNNSVTIMNDEEILETMELTKAYNEAHEGAILLHQGETYVVEDLNLSTFIARVRKKDVDYYTETKKKIEISIKNNYEKDDNGIEINLGELNVTEFYNYYIIKKYDTVIGRKPLDLEPLNFSTIGLWLTIPEDIIFEVNDRSLDFSGGLHAVEHALIAMSPLFAMCDKRDIGGVSSIIHFDTKKPTIFLYDGYEGGIGISEKLFELIDKLLKNTLNLIKECECECGCPSCIYSSRCGNENEPLDKEAAIVILTEIIRRKQRKNFSI